MAENKFILDKNQKVWDSYYNGILKSWLEENRELEGEVYVDEFNKKRTSVLQYKPIVVEFEKYINKPFGDITIMDIENFKENTSKKSKLNHLNSFLVASTTKGYIKNVDLEVLISLLPKAYRELGKMIAKI
jgi:hypothetical protein